MGHFLSAVHRLSKYMECIAGITLVFIMLLTVADVCLRWFGHPIKGTFEMVALGGAIVIGFAVPITSWLRAHIYVDFFILNFPSRLKAAFNIGTRVLSIGLFFLIGYNLFLYAGELYASGEVTLTRQLPFYPIAYGIGACCFLECIVLITDIIKVVGGDYE